MLTMLHIAGSAHVQSLPGPQKMVQPPGHRSIMHVLSRQTIEQLPSGQLIRQFGLN